MAGKRVAAIALSLVYELGERLSAAGVTGESAPTLDEALDAVWLLARQLAKLEKTGEKAGKSAARARAVVLGSAVACYPTAVRPRSAESGPPGWAVFDPARWHVALLPGAPAAADRGREAA
jgi:hypothetical protein